MTQPIAPYKFAIQDVFRFADGSTVFVGIVHGSAGALAPCDVDLVVDGSRRKVIRLHGERMSGPAMPGSRVVFTRDFLDPAEYKGRERFLIAKERIGSAGT